MVFEYKEYYSSLVTLSLVFVIIACIALLIGIIIHIKPKYFGKMFNLNLGIHSFLIVVLIVSIIATIGITTIDFDLMFEEEDNKITMSGTVDEISSVNNPPKFTYQGMPVTPKYITIDGQKYYIMYIGDIIEGDEVVFEVLPESKIVLSIYKEE